MHAAELAHISITVGKLPEAAAFYQQILGFPAQPERTIDDPAWLRLIGLDAGVKARAQVIEIGRQSLELVAFDPPGRPYPQPRAANDPWFQHIAIVIEDTGEMQRLCRQLEEATAQTPITRGGPQRLPPNTGGVTAFKFRDHEGHPLELLHLPPGVGADVWHANPGSGALGYDHSAIVVGDVGRSIAFYTGLLGFRSGGRTLNRGPEQDRLDGLDGTEVDVVGLIPAEVATPHLELLAYRNPAGHFLADATTATDLASARQILRVQDLEGLVGRLREAGVAFVSPGMVSLPDGAAAAAIRDPDGHMIVLTH